MKICGKDRGNSANKKIAVLCFAICCNFFLIQTIVKAFQATPEPNAPRVPFNIQAPWPAELSWMAAGSLGGSYFGQNLHLGTGPDAYAIDFNGANPTDGGTLVFAATDGRVVDADCTDNGSFGCRVVLGHITTREGDCYETMYAHLRNNSILVTEGMTVTQGQPLGRVGASGGVPGEHLHFAVHKRFGYECDPDTPASPIEGNGRDDWAVVPEPINGVNSILSGTIVTSTNFPVGYTVLTRTHLHEGADLPERHMPIVSLYNEFGGQFGLFGPAKGYVQQLDDLELFYQEFEGQTFNETFSLYEIPTVIVEHNRRGYLLLDIMWEKYNEEGDGFQRYGLPISHAYLWNGGTSNGYRVDFHRDVSMVWDGAGPVEILFGGDSDLWEAELWPEPNNFNGPSHIRFDKSVDFSWEDVSKPGPFVTDSGFSGIWTRNIGRIISCYQMNIEYQGNLEVKVNNNQVLNRSSPDSIMTETIEERSLFQDNIEVIYWQDEARSGRLKITVRECNLIREAIASEGEVTSSSIEPVSVEYAQFEPHIRIDGTSIPEPSYCPANSSNDGTYPAFDDENDIFVVCVDLTDPHLRFETVMANDILDVNPSPDQRETITSMVSREPHILHNPILAFNADYFGDGHGPEGFTINNGLRIDGPYSDDFDGNESNRVSQSISRLNWVELDSKSLGEVSDQILHLSRFYNSSGGDPTILEDGNVISDPCEAEGFPPAVCQTNTHTAVGISEDGLTFIVVVAESKSAMEMGQILQAYDAYSGIKLSGGTTSQLWYRGEDKVLGNPVANAMLIFREEIPRHDAIILEQSQFPVVQAGERFTVTIRLGNTGFLPWEAQLDYALQYVDGEQFSIPSPRFLPATVDTGYDLTITLEGIAPETPGAYQSIWQFIYQDSRGFIEPVSKEIGFLVTVLPEGASLDFGDSLQQFIDQFLAEIEGNIRDYLDQLEGEIEARIRAELLKLIPPELRCLFGLSMVFSQGWAFTLWRRKKEQNG